MLGGNSVCRVPNDLAAAERARWLAELSEALNQAHDVIRGLQLEEGERAVAQELYLRIEAARFEVQSLRLSRSLTARSETRPEWVDSEPWQFRSASGGAHKPCGRSPPPANGSR
jgi:hypothetical protein